MLVIAHGAVGSAAARVIMQVRRGGVTMREDLVQSIGLSAATVSRAVSALTDARLLRQRPDIVRVGAVGRPTVPVQLDPDHFIVVGLHVGRVTTVISLADLNGRVIAKSVHATPASVDGFVVLVGAGVAALLDDFPDRTVLSVGLVAPWGDLGLRPEDVSASLGEMLGIDVATADHITAIAAAEHTAGLQGADGTTVYVYARDTIGFAIAHDRDDRTVVTRALRLTHFPTGSKHTCRCRTVGCLEATASDEALGRRAHGGGITTHADVGELYAAAAGGSARADEILRERASVLGRAAAFVRDMIDPDQIVLVGQGFTRYGPAREQVLESFRDSTTLPEIRVDFGQYGADLQPVAASSVALGVVFTDPLGAVDRAHTKLAAASL